MSHFFKSDDERWKFLRYKILEGQIAGIFEKFREKDIEPILIKGWAASLFYSKKFERIFSDFDIVVKPSDYVRARKIIIENSLTIDLHCGFIKHDTVDWEEIFDNSVLVEIGETPIRIPSSEDHLRILCVHWLNDGGVFKNKLLDIYYLIRNRGRDFDWERCLGVVDLKRRRWILTVIAVVRDYFELDVSELPFRDELGEVPSWMKATLEKEWRESVPLRPLQTCLKDFGELKKQLKKRFPPNPIQATIECSGEFDESGRAKYQIKSIFFRTFPAIVRISRTIFTGKKY